MKIAIGADHRGFKQKQLLIDHFAQDEAISLSDVGTCNEERTDFPIYTSAVIQLMEQNLVEKGILLCGSGIGIAIAANRYDGIYAGVTWNETVARKAKEHNNVNVLIVPSDYIDDSQVVPIVLAWLNAAFLEGRYAKRLAMIDRL